MKQNTHATHNYNIEYEVDKKKFSKMMKKIISLMINKCKINSRIEKGFARARERKSVLN